MRGLGEQGQAVVVERDGGKDKTAVALSCAAERVAAMLDRMQVPRSVRDPGPGAWGPGPGPRGREARARVRP